MARRSKEEDVLRITAQYVEEWRAGKQPKASDYLTRYPQYAEDIADFVAYYHAVEAKLPSTSEITALAPELHIAIDAAWQRIAQSGELPKVAEAPAHYETQATGFPEEDEGSSGAVKPQKLASDE